MTSVENTHVLLVSVVPPGPEAPGPGVTVNSMLVLPRAEADAAIELFGEGDPTASLGPSDLERIQQGDG